MGMDEKDLKDFMNEQMQDVSVPDSLKPENIGKLLEEKGKKRRKQYHQKVLAAAACCVVIVGIAAAGANGMFRNAGGVTAEYTEGDTADSGEEKGMQTDSPQESSAGGSDIQTSGEPAEQIASAKDYREIYQYIQAEQQYWERMYGDMDMGYAVVEDAAEYASDTTAAASEGTGGTSVNSSFSGISESVSSSEDYSDTNVREEEVGEADIVKTDGKRLYILNNRHIEIVGIEQEEMEVLGVIDMDAEDYVSEIYIKDDRLVVVYTRSEYEEAEDASGSQGGFYKEHTTAETFDVSKPESPKSLGKVSQSGNYCTMRAVGDYVYLFSTFYAGMPDSWEELGRYIPEVGGELLESGDILIPQMQRGDEYTVISAFSLKEPGEKTDSKAVFGTSGLCYVSSNNIYICESSYDSSQSNVSQTCIRKIAYENGKLNAVGQTSIDGTLNDSFSIDEYEGNLRLVTTVSSTVSSGTESVSLFSKSTENEIVKDSNSLYILDENLKELSRIEGLAEDETVYSARFMGDTGYFVTYRQMDPLFSVDLSDPENPEIIGTLKIPGFSEYLHPYGDGLLLGIGMDTDETGTTTNGVKLSMFDISDPAEVEEIEKFVLQDFYSTEVSYNYKAALVSVQKNLIGFPVYGQEQHYYVFSYGSDGFTCLLDRELSGYYSGIRALYVGDRLYLIAGNTIEAFRLDTFDKVDDIVL